MNNDETIVVYVRLPNDRLVDEFKAWLTARIGDFEHVLFHRGIIDGFDTVVIADNGDDNLAVTIAKE